jgi:pyridoxamine 5'-phosphate oxidase
MQKPNHLAHDPTLEIAWWIEETAVQFRITGKGYTISPDAEAAKKTIEEMGIEGDETDLKFWENKRDEVWKDFSSHLRGSFGRPPPGRKISDVKEKPEDWTVKLDTSSVGHLLIHAMKRTRGISANGRMNRNKRLISRGR